MAGPDPIGAIASAVTNQTQFANPASSGGAGPDQVTLSDMAQKMLSSVSNLQNDFQDAMKPGAEHGAAPVEATPNSNMDSVAMLGDQIQRSSEVQAQLTRFVMASSMSSSLGRNLNMFLRGQ